MMSIVGLSAVSCVAPPWRWSSQVRAKRCVVRGSSGASATRAVAAVSNCFWTKHIVPHGADSRLHSSCKCVIRPHATSGSHPHHLDTPPAPESIYPVHSAHGHSLLAQGCLLHETRLA